MQLHHGVTLLPVEIVRVVAARKVLRPYRPRLLATERDEPHVALGLQFGLIHGAQNREELDHVRAHFRRVHEVKIEGASAVEVFVDK